MYLYSSLIIHSKVTLLRSFICMWEQLPRAELRLHGVINIQVLRTFGVRMYLSLNLHITKSVIESYLSASGAKKRVTLISSEFGKSEGLEY
jgi:hypothetical protein